LHPPSQRDALWRALDQPWDVLVVGGGITGAAILHAAAGAGLRALLVERGDFASGTSSRSTKLVHGGFRYLAQGQLKVVRHSAHERRRLLADWPGLIEPLGFLLPSYRDDRLPPAAYRAALTLYGALAGQRSHRQHAPPAFAFLMPQLERAGLRAGFSYAEATVDDARLVLRLLAEADSRGAVALNYVAATGLLRDGDEVVGARLRDEASGDEREVRARVVVNATGAWSDRLRAEVGARAQMRPLRGSHLVFPFWRLPLAQAVGFRHPLDGRYVCAVPWEGVTLVGTTDLDHRRDLDDEPAITPGEVAYLMAAAHSAFPTLALGLDDVLATYSGVRPVLDTGKADPSKESRDYAVMDERGLLTVTGGKLTTFRMLAHDALALVLRRLPAGSGRVGERQPEGRAAAPRAHTELSASARTRLQGRYGAAAESLIAAAQPGELEPIAGTPTLWAELRWAARSEAVVHLDDLLLRRVRLGLLLPEGGASILPRVRAICQAELGWGDARWEAEEAAYLQRWRAHYGLPARETIPDWRAQLQQVQAQRLRMAGRRKRARRAALAGIAALGGGLALWRRLRPNRSLR
jgi:glycerol-3-phosphate dehydrogenase